MGKGTCSVLDCESGVYAKRLCNRHYLRNLNNGDPLITKRPGLGRSPIERFWSKVDQRGPDECWPWKGKPVPKTGYGTLQVSGKAVRAHRFSWEIQVGPIPPGMFLDHLCHNADRSCRLGVECPHRLCVNPKHLKPVTPRTNGLSGNTYRADNARKTRCINGHEFTSANTKLVAAGRKCRACENARTIAWRRGRRQPSE